MIKKVQAHKKLLNFSNMSQYNLLLFTPGVHTFTTSERLQPHSQILHKNTYNTRQKFGHPYSFIVLFFYYLNYFSHCRALIKTSNVYVYNILIAELNVRAGKVYLIQV